MADSEGSSQPPPDSAQSSAGAMDVDEPSTTAAPPSTSETALPLPTPTQPDAASSTSEPAATDASQDAQPPASVGPAGGEPAGGDDGDEPSEVELLRARHLREAIEQEQAVADALEKVTELQTLLDKEKKASHESKQREDGLGQSLQHLETKHTELQRSVDTQATTNASLQARLAQVETSNFALLSTVQEHKEQRDQSQAEVLQLRTKNAAWERRTEQVEGELATRRLESNNFGYKVEALERALQLSNADESAAKEELSRTTQSFIKYRSTKESETQSLHLEVESLRAQLSTSNDSLSALRRSQASLTERLNKSNVETANLRTSLAEQKTNFKVELTSLSRQLESADRRADEARLQYEDIEREWEADQQRRKGAEEVSQEERSVWAGQRQEYEGKVAELRDTVERLAEAGARGDTSADYGGLLSPTASLASSLMKNKSQSLSDVYVENVKIKNELGRQKEETVRLEECLRTVMRDISERAPVFKQQRKDHEVLLGVADEQANQIATLTSERALLSDEQKRLESKVRHTESELGALQTHFQDITRQKTALVRQLAIRDDPSLADQIEDEERFDGENTQSIISQNFILYKSIPDLVSRNEHLVKLTRSLAEKMDASVDQEAVDESPAEMKQALSDAADHVEHLREKIAAKDVQLEKSTRERDMFSRMLSQAGITLPAGSGLEDLAGGAGSANVIELMKQNMESFRQELGLDAERLRGELVEVRRELGTANGNLARAESERDYWKEQVNHHKDKNELQQVEFSGLAKQTQLLKDDINRLNVNLRNAEDKRIDAEGTAERLRTEAANIRAEKELWKSIETRLQSDLAQIAKDQSALELLNQNLRNVEAENTRTQSELRQKNEQHISTLENDRAKLREDVSKLKAAATADVAGIVAEKNTLKVERDQAVADVDAVKSRLDNVTSNLMSHRQKAETDRSKFQEFMSKRTAERTQATTEIKTLTDQVAQHTTDMSNKTNEATALAKQLQVKTAEYERARVKLSMVEGKATAGAALLEKITALEAERDSLLAKIKEAPAGAASSAELDALRAERDSLASQLEAAKTAAADAAPVGDVDQRITDLRVERDSLKELLRTAQAASPASDPDAQRKITELEAELESANGKLAITDIDAKLKEQEKTFIAAKASYVKAERGRYEQVFRDAKRLNTESKEHDKKIKVKDDKIATLETELVELKANPPPAPATDDSAPKAEGADAVAPAPVSQDVIDSAVQEAIAKLATSHEEALAARERQVREELALAAPASSEGAAASTSTVDVEAAVQTAVSAREEELRTAHATQLASELAAREKELSDKTQSAVEEAVKTALASIPPPPPPPAPVTITAPADPAEIEKAVKAAVAAREAELKTQHDEALKAATAAAASSAPASEPTAAAPAEDPAVRQAAIDAAVLEALERQKRETASKTAAQKNMLDRLKKDNAALKAQVAAAPAAASAPTGPAAKGGPTPSQPRATAAAMMNAVGGPSTAPPTAEAMATRGRASLGGASPVAPTAPAGGASIRGAGAGARGAGAVGRGGGATRGGVPGGRGGAAAGAAGAGVGRGGGAAGAGARKPPGNLFSGAIGALGGDSSASAAPGGGAGAAKRPREDDASPGGSATSTPLLDRLNSAAKAQAGGAGGGGGGGRPVIKRPKKDGEGGGGAEGE